MAESSTGTQTAEDLLDRVCMRLVGVTEDTCTIPERQLVNLLVDAGRMAWAYGEPRYRTAVINHVRRVAP